MKTVINTKNAPAAIGPYSQAILLNNQLYTSGQIGINPETSKLEDLDIETETYQVFKNLKALLEEAKMTFNDVVKVSIFLKNMDDFSTVNRIYAEHFSEPFPARETVQVAKLPKDVRIEISLIASL